MAETRLADKEMDRFSAEILRALLAEQNEIAISFFMPTYRMGADIQQNTVRLKNLLDETKRKLSQRGYEPEAIQRLLTPVHNLQQDRYYWQHQSDGLALFLNSENLWSHRLPLTFDEIVVVGERFYVKPLLPMLNSDGTFYILALDQGGVQLLQGTRYSVGEMDLGEDIPQSLQEALQYDDIESHLQFHTRTGRAHEGGERGAMFHGQGASSDEASDKEYIVRFFRALDNGVRDLIEESQAPLLLAGVEYLRGLYRQVNRYEPLMANDIDSHPHDLSTEALHQRAWEIVSPYFAETRQKASDVYKHLRGTADPRAASDIETIVPAAYFQRVDTLFVAEEHQIWGAFDADQNAVTLHDTAQTDSEDLLDFAAVHTLLNGGSVYAISADEMPDSASAAAVFRY